MIESWCYTLAASNEYSSSCLCNALHKRKVLSIRIDSRVLNKPGATQISERAQLTVHTFLSLYMLFSDFFPPLVLISCILCLNSKRLINKYVVITFLKQNIMVTYYFHVVLSVKHFMENTLECVNKNTIHDRFSSFY